MTEAERWTFDVAGLRASAAAWDRAMVSNDPDAIGRFMEGSWRIIGGDGVVTDRATFLAQIRDGRLSHDTMTTEDADVRIFGTVGVLEARGVSGGLFDGRSFRVVERQTSLFAYETGAWRCVLTHLSPLLSAAGPR